MWHSYQKGPLHSQGLASWAVDWRSGVIDEVDRAALKHHTRSYQASIETNPKVLHPNNYVGFFRRPRELFEVRDVYLAQGWTPLWAAPTPEIALDYRAAETDGDWYWPRSLQSDRYVLSVKARMLNYVAHLMDFTCDTEDFIEQFNKSKHSEGLYPFELNQAGLSIHARVSVDPHGYLFHRLRWTTPYDPERHSWRLAVLGVANDAHFCLVPPTAAKGDLVIAVAPEMLPMLIHPTYGDGTAGGLFKSDDAYGTLQHGALLPRRRRPGTRLLMRPIAWLVKMLMIPCMPVLLFLVVLFLTNPAEYLQPQFTVPPGLVLFFCSAFLLLNPPIRALHRCVGIKHFERMRFPHGTKIEGLPEACLDLGCLLASMLITRGQLAVTVFWTLHTACWLPGYTLRFYRQTNDEIQRAVQRAKVVSHLNDAAQKIGQDYVFRGPVFVYQKRSGKTYEDFTALGAFARWCGFVCVVVVNKLLKGKKPQLSRSQREIVWLDAFQSEAHAIGKVGGSAWNRPIQEFWLH